MDGALENTHRTYHVFKIWTIMHNFLTFGKLNIQRYWLFAHEQLLADSSG
jgi:hypothetical protein